MTLRLPAEPVLLAVYDLDRTITSLPTWTPFLLEAAWRRAPWRLALLPALGAAALARAVGAIDRDRLKVVMHRLLLGPTLPAAAAQELAERFAERFVRHHIQPGARRQLEHDRAGGRRIVVATAAHRFYAEAIARRLGVADLVATEVTRNGEGAILPTLDGANCYGAAKQAMLVRWLAGQGLARESVHLRFYSDHASDAPTFDWADEAVVVNAGARLRGVAEDRGWKVADWRR